MTNNTDYRYRLDSPRVTGRRQQKATCPQCGRKSLVRYVDTHNLCQYVSNLVGRCDHEHSCGYHYRPSEYFSDHPWLGDRQPAVKRPWLPPPPAPLQPLPMRLVTESHTPQSTLWQWLSGDCARRLGLAPEMVRRVYENYYVGATRESDVIYWQIDCRQRVRTGHIMQYGPDGHRLGYQNWVHNKLKEQGLLPRDWPLYQCLFGEHLLPFRKQAHVCLVESEKTALVMAARHPDQLWIATGGCGGLSAVRLECLRGRRVTLFPDSGCLEKWRQLMGMTTGISYNFCEQIESYAENTDLVDVLLGEASPR